MEYITFCFFVFLFLRRHHEEGETGTARRTWDRSIGQQTQSRLTGGLPGKVSPGIYDRRNTSKEERDERNYGK